jgi:hypothetical protein
MSAKVLKKSDRLARWNPLLLQNACHGKWLGYGPLFHAFAV